MRTVQTFVHFPRLNVFVFAGVAYGWGFGSNLQLTTGEEDDEWTPVALTGKNLEDRKVLDVAAGGQHTVVLASLKNQVNNT